MKIFNKMAEVLAILTICFTVTAQAGYDCKKLLDDDGTLGPTIVSLDSLNKDEGVLSGLGKPFYFEDAVFVKYQYWIDAGDGYHMVHFIGVSNRLDENEQPFLVTKNLFCKDDGAVAEGGI